MYLGSIAGVDARDNSPSYASNDSTGLMLPPMPDEKHSILGIKRQRGTDKQDPSYPFLRE